MDKWLYLVEVDTELDSMTTMKKRRENKDLKNKIKNKWLYLEEVDIGLDSLETLLNK